MQELWNLSLHRTIRTEREEITNDIMPSKYVNISVYGREIYSK